MPDINLDNIRANKDRILTNDSRIGGYTVKSEARQTGCSIYFTFDNKVDVMTTLEFINLVTLAPGALVNAFRLLLGEEQIIDTGGEPIT